MEAILNTFLSCDPLPAKARENFRLFPPKNTNLRIPPSYPFGLGIPFLCEFSPVPLHAVSTCAPGVRCCPAKPAYCHRNTGSHCLGHGTWSFHQTGDSMFNRQTHFLPFPFYKKNSNFAHSLLDNQQTRTLRSLSQKERKFAIYHASLLTLNYN